MERLPSSIYFQKWVFEKEFAFHYKARYQIYKQFYIGNLPSRVESFCMLFIFFDFVYHKPDAVRPNIFDYPDSCEFAVHNYSTI